MILKDTATFQVLFIVSLFCAWNIATVEINSGVHLLKSYIRQVPLFTSGCLGLVILVFILRIWSCLHHWIMLCGYWPALSVNCIHFTTLVTELSSEHLAMHLHIY